MSLMISTISRPFTISTYDPPSTPIALAAQTSGQSQSPDQGQRLGGKAESRRTPPDQDKDSDSARARLKALDKTPSNRAKVLPWVEGIMTEGYQPPEGMFGPYDSQPPTRRQTVVEPTGASPPRHPFAYNAGRSLPFSALAGETEVLLGEGPSPKHGSRPQSDVLSRGAALKAFAEHISPTGSNGSPGMGTFGREASLDPMTRASPPRVPPKSPLKSARNSPRKPVPTDPPPTTPKARSAAHTVQAIAEKVEGSDLPHIHHPHNDFPFSLEDAGRKQDEAMAHLEALQRLEAGNSPVSPRGGLKGPRETYETMTSGPSFGHIYHKNGMPVPGSRGPSMLPQPRTAGHGFNVPGDTGMVRETGGFGGGAIFHLPFGSNMSIPLPGPLLFGGGGGFQHSGLFAPNELSQVIESPESGRDAGQRRDDRSAYVETVQDEQEPTAKPSRSRATSKADKTALRNPQDGTTAQPESNVLPRQSVTTGRASEIPQARSAAQRQSLTRSPDTHRKSRAPTATPRSTKAPSGAAASVIPSHTGARLPKQPEPTHKSHSRGQTAPPAPTTGAHTMMVPSVAPTIHRTHVDEFPTSQRDESHHHLETTQHPNPIAEFAALGPFLGSYMRELARAAEEQVALAGHGDHLDQPQQLGSAAHIDDTGRGSRIPSGVSHAPTQGTAPVLPDTTTPAMPPTAFLSHRHDHEELHSPYAPSIVSTTPSNIKRAVAESKFHDEILCQLLDAARLNLIGDEAKKALNRAARARVIELRDLRARGELTEEEMLLPRCDRGRKERKKRSKDTPGRRHSRHRSDPSESGGKARSITPTKRSQSRERHSRGQSEHTVAPIHPLPPVTPKRTQPTTPPEWAQSIIERLAAFDERFSELERQQKDAQHFEEPSQDIPGDLIDELMFNTQHFTRPGAPTGIHGVSMPMDINPFGFPFPRLSFGDSTPAGGGAQIRTISPSVKQRDTNGTLEWGSDVELPLPEEKVSPPKTPRTATGPIINIQAPTESNIEKSQRAPTPSVAGTRVTAPKRTEVDVIEEQMVSLPDPALPDPTERDLPPRPSESNRSYRPSPVSKSTPFDRPYPSIGDTPLSKKQALNFGVAQTVPANEPVTIGMVHSPAMQPRPRHSSMEVPESQTAYRTAYQSMPQTPPKAERDIIRVVDPIHTTMADPTPWDLVTQRLYSWALVWDEHAFSRAMQEISLGKQVEEFALSIFVMTIFKRMLRRSLSETPLKICDKLFVPPTMADAINKAVHANNHKAAQQMLEEMWYPFLFKEPPRVIIALARHLADDDGWTAHRWDLTTGRLRSYKVCHAGNGIDGRPFMWWHAIRAAWPQYNIRDPSELAQQTTTINTSAADKNNNSLLALNCARNLFLGFRPEHPTDLAKLRESVWGEVKRLLNKKKMGRLIVEMDSPSHATSY